MGPQRQSFDSVEIDVSSVSQPYELTAEEIREMSLRWDPWDFHVDDGAAADSEFSGLAASSIHVLAIANLLGHVSGPTYDIRAGFGGEYRHPSAARAGDQLTLTQVVTSKRPSTSRPGSGVISLLMTLRNQESDPVLEQTVQLLIGPGQ